MGLARVPQLSAQSTLPPSITATPMAGTSRRFIRSVSFILRSTPIRPIGGRSPDSTDLRWARASAQSSGRSELGRAGSAGQAVFGGPAPFEASALAEGVGPVAVFDELGSGVLFEVSQAHATTVPRASARAAKESRMAR